MAFLCVELQILKCEGEHFGMAQTFKEEIGKRKWINLESHETHFTQSALFSVKRMFANFSAWRLFMGAKTSWRFGIGFEFINYRKSATSMKLFVIWHSRMQFRHSAHNLWIWMSWKFVSKRRQILTHNKNENKFPSCTKSVSLQKSQSRNEAKPAKTPEKK